MQMRAMNAGFMLSQMDELKSGAARWYPVGCCIFYVCIISSAASAFMGGGHWSVQIKAAGFISRCTAHRRKQPNHTFSSKFSAGFTNLFNFQLFPFAQKLKIHLSIIFTK